MILLERSVRGVPKATPAYLDLVFQRAPITLEIIMDKLKSNLHKGEKHLSSGRYLHSMYVRKKVLILLERGLQGVPRATPAYFDLVFQRARIGVQL